MASLRNITLSTIIAASMGGCTMLADTIPAELVGKRELKIMRWTAQYNADVLINGATASVMRFGGREKVLKEYNSLEPGLVEVKSLHGPERIINAEEPRLVERVYNVR